MSLYDHPLMGDLSDYSKRGAIDEKTIIPIRETR